MEAKIPYWLRSQGPFPPQTPPFSRLIPLVGGMDAKGFQVRVVMEGNTPLAVSAREVPPSTCDTFPVGIVGSASIRRRDEGGWVLGGLGTRVKCDAQFAKNLATYGNEGEKQMLAQLGHKMLCFSISILKQQYREDGKTTISLWPSGTIYASGGEKEDQPRLVQYYRSLGFQVTSVDENDKNYVWEMTAPIDQIEINCKRAASLSNPKIIKSFQPKNY